MNGKLTDRELEDIRERSRLAWNRLIAEDEAEYRALHADEPDHTRPQLRVIDGGGDE